MRPSSVQPCQIRPCVDEAIAAFASRHPELTVSAIFDPRVPSTVLCQPGPLAELLTLLLERATVPPGSRALTFFVFETDDPHSCVLRFELHGAAAMPLPPAASELAARLGGEAGQSQEGSRSAWFTLTANRRPPDPAPLLSTILGDISILVAEDNEVNQRVALECLRHLGYSCRIAENGKEAVRFATAERFDFILMDIHMPTMDGITATRAIRALPGTHRPFIAALTAFALPGDKARCLEAGMDDYLTKPCRMEDLTTLLTKAAGQRKNLVPARL